MSIFDRAWSQGRPVLVDVMDQETGSVYYWLIYQGKPIRSFWSPEQRARALRERK